MEPLIVSKALEHKGKIGPFFLHELVGLLLGCMLLFFGVLLLKSLVAISRLWLLLSPALFLVVTGLVKALRQEEHPSLFLAWLSFHWQQPKHLGPPPASSKTQLIAPPGTQLCLFDQPHTHDQPH